MWKDPIVEEIRQTREAHSRQFNYDLKAIYQDLKEQEKQETICVLYSVVKERIRMILTV